MAAGAFAYVIKANHTPNEVVDLIRKKLGLQVSKHHQKVPRDLLQKYITEPTHDPVHAEPIVLTQLSHIELQPVKKPIRRITINVSTFYPLIGLSVIGVIAILIWIFS